MSIVGLQLNNSFALPVKELLGDPSAISPPTPVANEPVQVPLDGEKEKFSLEKSDIKASFSYDQELKQIIIVLKSEETGEVIRQFPPEKILHLLAGFAELSGKKVDEKA